MGHFEPTLQDSHVPVLHRPPRVLRQRHGLLPAGRPAVALPARPSPSHASWLPSDSSFGCAPLSPSNLYRYRDSAPWPPFSYGPAPAARLAVSLRHFQDPFIVAAAITGGCSAATTAAASCFGRSIEEDRLIALVLIAIGGMGLAAGLLVALRGGAEA